MPRATATSWTTSGSSCAWPRRALAWPTGTAWAGNSSSVGGWPAPPATARFPSPRGIDRRAGGERALVQAEAFRLSVLLMHGSADRIIDPQATQAFYDRAGSPDKTLRIWPGLFHETHNEPAWEQVVAVSTGWARAHAG